MRKVDRLSILAAFTLTLAACQSSAPPTPPPQPVATAATQRAPLDPSPLTRNRQPATGNSPDHRPLLVCFGDSLTFGQGAPPGQSYPDFLQADLDQLHLEYHVDNEGVSGETSKDGVDRLPEILALHPAVVVVEFGGNDGLRGLPNPDTRANLDKIIGKLKDSGAKVAIAGITLPPDYGEDYIREFNATYVILAKKYHVPMLPFLLQHVYGVPGMMQSDRTHATGKGNRIVAEDVLHLVQPLLKK